jgi:hypothetical protein
MLARVMMAPGHANSGALLALILAWLAATLGHPIAAGLGLLAALSMAGAAIASDLDHRSATATTSLGPVTLGLHYLVVLTHNLTVGLVRKSGDRREPPAAHRGITHWPPFAVLFGAGVSAACWAHPWAAAPVLTLLYVFGIRGLAIAAPRCNGDSGRDWRKRRAWGVVRWVPTIALQHALYYGVKAIGRIGVLALGAGLAALTIWLYAPYLTWLGALIALGMLVHIAGDRPTEAGTPSILRLTWTVRWPKWLAFRAGGAFEMLVMWAPMSLGITAMIVELYIR